MAERRASATWQGSLMEGSGRTELGSGAAGPLDVTWEARTSSDNPKTSPEELIAAAHAACFSMALSHGLALGGNAPEQLDTDAVATFGPKEGGGFEIKSIALRVRGRVPGMDEAAFRQAAEGAKEGCPVSQALKGNVEITLDAALA
jgi:osmotically inducible protein OsmC